MRKIKVQFLRQTNDCVAWKAKHSRIGERRSEVIYTDRKKKINNNCRCYGRSEKSGLILRFRYLDT